MFLETLPISHSLSFKCLATPFFYDPNYEKKSHKKIYHFFIRLSTMPGSVPACSLLRWHLGANHHWSDFQAYCTWLSWKLTDFSPFYPWEHLTFLISSNSQHYFAVLFPSFFVSLPRFFCLCLFLVGLDSRTPGLVHARQELSCYQAQLVTNFPSAS